MMPLSTLLVAQLLAHTLSDFYLQPQRWADAKQAKGFASGGLYLHILMTFAVAWALSFRFDYGIYAAGLALSHLLMDGVKGSLAKFEGLKGWLFFLDQFYHVVAVAATVYLFQKYNADASLGTDAISHDALLHILGFALCIRPANFAIQEILIANKIKIANPVPNETNHETDLPGAGRLIGAVERLLAFTLILVGQFSAVGFILAAKSILRYKEGDSARTEYVLVGSLLSFAIALGLGLVLS